MFCNFKIELCIIVIFYLHQAAWWGHPITSGVPSIDFYFGLDTEIDDANLHYSEQLVRFQYMSTIPFHAVLMFILLSVFIHSQKEINMTKMYFNTATSLR